MTEKPTYQDLENQINEFKVLFDTINEGIYSTDSGIITNVNKSFCDLFGYTKNELVGLPVWNLAKTELQNEVKERFIQRVQLRDNTPIETTCMRKNGEIFIAEITVSSLSETTQNFGVFRNISEKIQKEKEIIKAKEKAQESERELIKQNKLFSTLLNNLKQGVFMVEAPSGKPIIANETALKLLGRGILSDANLNNISEVYKAFKIGTNLAYPLEELPILLGMYGKTSYIDDMIVQRPDGTLTHLEVFGTPVAEAEGKIWASLVSFSDISERKEFQQKIIEAKEKAEESDRLKTAFLQNMSHEIRTPLNGISGFSGLLNKTDLSEEKRKSFVSIIQNSSQQLISIVSDILTISSLETKQEKTSISKVCINNIIVELLAIFKQLAMNQNISLYAKQQLSDKQSEIYSDNTKITQILSNLLSNALKFTHEGFIEFGYNLKDTELEFYVKDSGIGIKPEFHDKIFERFRQADKSINKLYGGTGLGLAISKAFVELLGGKIWVQSELEKGSIFNFTIPYKPVNEIDKTISPTIQNRNGRTILVAEDEEYNFLLIEELLIDMDLKLIHAKDGQEAVDICKSNPNIELILMDIKMPRLSGYEAAKLIKEFQPDLPIIAQSAYALEHEIEKYSRVFDDYLTKPIKEEILIEKVNKYMLEK